MTCPHCQTPNSDILPFTRSIDGGRAYAQSCTSCGHVLGIRPRLQTDPVAVPCDLNEAEASRLRFVRWRLAAEVEEQVSKSNRLLDQDSPLSAA